jgi:uncharacterized protein (TIGR00251 family)
LAALTASPPWRVVADGLAVQVRLTPKAAQDRIDGIDAGPGGAAILRARVRAAPEGGKANAALLRLLAKSWRMPKSALAVTSGATGRSKTVTIGGDGPTLAARLDAWRATTGNPT